MDSGFHAVDSGLWALDSLYSLSVDLVSNRWWDSAVQSPEFRLPPAKASRDPDSTNKNFPDTGIQIPLREGLNRGGSIFRLSGKIQSLCR